MGNRANAITEPALRTKWRGADRWLSDGGSRGAGRLVAKISETGAMFYFQHFDSEGCKRFWPIDPHDSAGVRGISLQSARDRAAELSTLYRKGTKDLHAHFGREREAQDDARRQAEDAAKREVERAQRSTLRQLLDAYVAHLERLGKQATANVRNIFARHVFEAAPDLAGRRAAEISVDDFVELIGKLAEAGKGRTAAKLRSYLRAAYSLAIKSKTDPDAPLTLRTFGIDSNPLASIGALSKYNRTRDRTLSAEELRAFLKRVEAMPDSVKKDAVSLCLLLGGQRPAQLLRAHPVDVDLSAATLVLYDPKGARQQPRRHVLPLTRKAVAILRRRLETKNNDSDSDKEDCPFVFSGDGKTALRLETLSAMVSDLSASMVKAKEAREPFGLRDIRRTCETQLAALGVSSDVRAQIQSHDLGGVQKRNYDRHQYALEKRAALETWQRHLDRLAAGKSAKVVSLTPKKVHA